MDALTGKIEPNRLRKDALLVRFEKWISNSNSALHLALVADESSLIKTFHPEFTYTFYGQDEKVFGYTGLLINLYFSAGSLFPYLGLKFKDQVNEKGLKPQNVLSPLKEKLPHDVTENFDSFIKTVKKDSDTFRPLGEKIHAYSISKDDNQRSFEVYKVALHSFRINIKADFTTPGFKEYHKRMQILLLFFIEGATFIDDDDENWEIITLYEKLSNNQYHFAGYITIYTYYNYPAKSRMKISQVLILPPFQRQGHGSRLYTYLSNLFVSRSDVTDYGVEDPNDSFTDMRDMSDVCRVLKDTTFVNMVLNALPSTRTEYLRRVFKFSKRQCERVSEIVLLKQVRGKGTSFKKFSDQVKSRLYRKNRDVLESMEKSEKEIRLNQTFDQIVEDYKLVLDKIAVK